jgi:hypothetical protein
MTREDLPGCNFKGSEFGSQREISRHSSGFLSFPYAAMGLETITGTRPSSQLFAYFICFRRQSHDLSLDLKSAANLGIGTPQPCGGSGSASYS